jgi:hypothetical protein
MFAKGGIIQAIAKNRSFESEEALNYSSEWASHCFSYNQLILGIATYSLHCTLERFASAISLYS